MLSLADKLLCKMNIRQIYSKVDDKKAKTSGYVNKQVLGGRAVYDYPPRTYIFYNLASSTWLQLVQHPMLTFSSTELTPLKNKRNWKREKRWIVFRSVRGKKINETRKTWKTELFWEMSVADHVWENQVLQFLQWSCWYLMLALDVGGRRCWLKSFFFSLQFGYMFFMYKRL